MIIKETWRDYWRGCPYDRRSISSLSFRLYDSPHGEFDLTRSYGHFVCARKGERYAIGRAHKSITVDIPGLIEAKSWIAAERLLDAYVQGLEA